MPIKPNNPRISDDRAVITISANPSGPPSEYRFYRNEDAGIAAVEVIHECGGVTFTTIASDIRITGR